MFFFFNDTATTEIYTLSLHDALPISRPLRLLRRVRLVHEVRGVVIHVRLATGLADQLALVHDAAYLLADRKSTRLNSSHANISYAVFCLKKKKTFEFGISNGLNHITS